MKNPAEAVIAKMGGANAVASLLNIDVSNVHRWKYPTERAGQGGLVPSKYQVVLLAEAKRLGIDLSPNDFFDTPAESNAAA